MGRAAGADIDGYNRGLLLATPGFYKDLDVYTPGWLVFVNREGRRFIDETTEYAVMSGVIKEQLGGTVFAVFDEQARASAKLDPAHEAAYSEGFTFTWGPEKLNEQIQKGKVLKAQTLEELADLAGLQSSTFVTTVERYNRDVAQNMDSLFFKECRVLKPIATPPFYAAEIRPAIVCLTSTGLRVDADMRVLDANDVPIPGLFAGGEVTGSVLGERYIGGGNSIANAIVFGRVAGESAAGASKTR